MEQCPVCFGELDVRECAPCDDCGAKPGEIDDFNQKIHTYTVYEVYKALRLTLCDFCAVDFGSYKPGYFGIRADTKLEFGGFNMIRQLENPQVVKDKFCPECEKRLTFLKFVAEVREMNR